MKTVIIWYFIINTNIVKVYLYKTIKEINLYIINKVLLENRLIIKIK